MGRDDGPLVLFLPRFCSFVSRAMLVAFVQCAVSVQFPLGTYILVGGHKGPATGPEPYPSFSAHVNTFEHPFVPSFCPRFQEIKACLWNLNHFPVLCNF